MKKKKLGGVLPKIVLAVLAVYAIVMIFTLQGKIKTSEKTNNSLKQELEQQTSVNESLQHDIDSAEDPASIAETAREEFGLVDSNETVFYDIGA